MTAKSVNGPKRELSARESARQSADAFVGQLETKGYVSETDGLSEFVTRKLMALRSSPNSRSAGSAPKAGA